MQKFSSFGRKKKNRPKFDIEWICPKTFNYSFVLFDVDYYTLIVEKCFMGQVKSL